jgi:hypothetical protein
MDISVNNMLLFVTGLCCFGTGVTAFRRYSMTQSERLFIVGIAMIMAAIGIICGALDRIFPLSPYALEWPWYFGTSIGYFLLFLSSIMNSVEQFRILKRWSIVAAAVFVISVALSAGLPHLDDNRSAIVAFNVLRTIICSLVFFRYLMLYTSKGTRFSLLFCLAFLFIGIGYFTIVVQTLEAVELQLPFIDLMIRAIGDALLFVAFVLG